MHKWEALWRAGLRVALCKLTHSISLLFKYSNKWKACPRGWHDVCFYSSAIIKNISQLVGKLWSIRLLRNCWAIIWFAATICFSNVNSGAAQWLPTLDFLSEISWKSVLPEICFNEVMGICICSTHDDNVASVHMRVCVCRCADVFISLL